MEKIESLAVIRACTLRQCTKGRAVPPVLRSSLWSFGPSPAAKTARNVTIAGLESLSGGVFGP